MGPQSEKRVTVARKKLPCGKKPRVDPESRGSPSADDQLVWDVNKKMQRVKEKQTQRGREVRKVADKNGKNSSLHSTPGNHLAMSLPKANPYCWHSQKRAGRVEKKKWHVWGVFICVSQSVCAANTRGFACLHVCYYITHLSKHADNHFCGCATTQKSQVPYWTSEANTFCSAASDVLW